MEDPTDSELVAQARQGSKEAFGQLAERYAPLGRRVARRMVVGADLADDLVQEALLQAYLSLHRLSDNERFRSWFYGIVLNVCRSFLRDQKFQPLSLESLLGGTAGEVAMSPAPGPHELAEQRDLHAHILAVVACLPPKDRLATLLFYYQAFSVREIAASLGMSQGAVRVHLHHARQRLRQQLLPLYREDERASAAPGRGVTMIPAFIADVVEQQGDDGRVYVVVLADIERRRALPIWIGAPEALAIARVLRDVTMPRPMTLEFVRSIVQAVNATLEEVQIATIQDQTFYAIVRLRHGDAVREIDARPSDALGLAAATGCPISIAAGIIETMGFEIPADQRDRLGQGLATLLERIDEQTTLVSRYRTRTKDEIEQSYQALCAALFGAASA